MSKEKILIFEDSEDDAANLRSLLEDKFKLYFKKDTIDLRSVFEESDPDVVLLDLNLGGFSGFDVLRQLSSDSQLKKIPVFIVSASNSTEDKINAISLGADDYLVKPFEEEILKLKIKTRIDKNKDLLSKKEIKYGPLRLKLSTQTLYVQVKGFDERQEALTKNECLLLELILKNKENITKKDEVFDFIWGNQNKAYSKCVDNYVSSIRKKIDPHAEALKTVYRIGYRLSFN